MRSYDWAKVGLAGALMLAGLGLSGCTTVEGTNAMTDPGTFEREVADTTLQGIGLLPQEQKPMIDTPRAPLVMPKDTKALPPPHESKVAELLPEDSDKVQIDTSALTEDDLRRLRNARVFDLRTASGRPLTETETRKLKAQIAQARVEARASTKPRSLILPPDEYFTTTASGQNMVCLAKNGDLVPVSDPACPPDVRAALQKQQAQ